jgi:Flp pilus assembly pilin Flp
LLLQEPCKAPLPGSLRTTPAALSPPDFARSSPLLERIIMSATWRSLLRDERGFVITAELVLISTVLVLGLVAALSAVKTALAGELNDVAGAIGSLNQSYYAHGFHGCGSRVSGSSFLDQADSSDELKADFATGLQACTPAAGVKTDCKAPPCNPPCAGQPCPGCGTGLPGPCNPPCGTSLAAPCGSAPCGAAYGSSCGGCGSTYQVIDGWARFGTSVPPVVCPPGPGPFTGTDPFAPGAVSPKNMFLQGISYGGVCAPPVAPSRLESPCPDAPAVQPGPVSQPCLAPCETVSASMPEGGPGLPAVVPAAVY